MPYFASENNNESASSELLAAGGSALGAFMATPWGTELGLNILKYGAKGAWGTAKFAGRTAKTITPPIVRGIAKTFNRTSVPVGKTVGKQIFQTGKQVFGGTAKAGLTAVSWVYKHPVMAPLAVGGIGAGLASFENRPVSVEMNAYSATDVMGGTSNTSMLMDEMQATGSIVFGLNNRR